MMKRKPAELAAFGDLLERYFKEWMVGQGKRSQRTVDSYRDAWRLFLSFLVRQRGIRVTEITIDMITAETVIDFLEHLTEERGCCAASRNLRLAAIRSFAKFVILKEPAYMAQFQRILMIPSLREDVKAMGYLNDDEMRAVLDAPDQSTRRGRRDHALLLFMYNTGARVSEAALFRMGDLKGSAVLIHGKGSKERVVPVWDETAAVLRRFAKERGAGPEDPLFVNDRGEQLTRHGISYIVHKSAAAAKESCPSIDPDKVTPHTLRHTTAMHLLRSDVDVNLIRMWLGHVNLKTVQVYAHSDVDMMRRALQKGGIIKDEGKYSWNPDEETRLFLETLGVE